jgi:hypothetical protein
MSKKQTERKSSELWLDEKRKELPGFQILDPDGWDRSNFEVSWKEAITKEEFERRCSLSTCKL